MATFDQTSLDDVRFYTDKDPYYYTIDNRPLRDLDGNIRKVADQMTSISDQATDAVEKSSGAVEQVTVIADQISAISNQASETITQVNEAVNQVNDAVNIVSGVISQVTDIESRLVVMDDKVTDVGEVVASYSDQITVIENQLTNVPHQFEDSAGATRVGWVQNATGSTPRTVANKLLDHIDVRDFGAVGDGFTDDRAAISLMAVAKGYVIFPPGTFYIPSNYTISVPQYYRDGASLLIAPTATLTINNRINSSNQWIFQGTGPVLIVLTTTGEDAQLVRGGWFGVFPSNNFIVDVTARLQRALSSLSSQTREGICQLECGSFHLSGTITVPRGVQIAGQGTRRTVFDIAGAPDYPIFVTGGNACKFSDFQFEYPTGEAKVRTAPYVQVNHNTVEIRDIWLFPTTVGIIIDGTQCTIRNLQVTYGLDPKSVGVSDTCVVWARSGAFVIDTILVNNTTYFPDHIVRVGHNITVGNGMINNIQTTSSANQVFFDGRAGSVTRVAVNNIVSNPSASSQFAGIVKMMSAGSSTITGITLNGLVGNSFADSLIHLEAADTSIISNISLGCASLTGSTGYGLRFINGATSTIRDIFVGGDVDVSSRPTRMQLSGTIGNIVAPPSVKGSSHQAPVVFNQQIADDAAFEITDNRSSIFSGILTIGSSNSGVWGIYSFRAAASANHVTQMVGSTNMATAITPLTGTTGVDGKFTIGVNASGKLVLENRIGSTITVTVSLQAGT